MRSEGEVEDKEEEALSLIFPRPRLLSSLLSSSRLGFGVVRYCVTVSAGCASVNIWLSHRRGGLAAWKLQSLGLRWESASTVTTATVDFVLLRRALSGGFRVTL